MDDRDPAPAALGIGRTALGRLEMSVPDEDGFQVVAVERRWPDPASARAWCERTVAKARPGTTVLEIQVFEERWSHARSWETTTHHPLAESLQVGVVAGTTVRWTQPRSMTPRAAAQHLL